MHSAQLPRLLTLLALALGAGQASAHEQDALAAKPACEPQPAMLDIDRSGPVVAPEDGEIGRSAGLSDRFLAQGQTVRYGFEAEVGELSLFELAVAGYARGWQAGARLRVLDANGTALAETSLEGGVVFRPFLAFQAPLAGRYQLEVEATREFFRYALIRHSDYAARSQDEVLAIGSRERVHGWIADGPDRMRFRVPVRAGEELVLKVEASREQARNERRAIMAATGAGMGGRMQAGMRSRSRGPDKQFPVFVLELGDESAASSRSSTFARCMPSADGEIEVAVRGVPGDLGGLFDLVVQRSSAKVGVHGLVVDADEQALPGTRLTFRLEPDLDPWGSVTTDASGAYALELPQGNYVIELARPDAQPHAPVKAGVRGELELNLIW